MSAILPRYLWDQSDPNFSSGYTVTYTRGTVRAFYSPKENLLDHQRMTREFRRYGYDPYNSACAFDVWVMFNARPE